MFFSDLKLLKVSIFLYFQVNCRGYNAFGRRKRSLDSENNTDLALPGDLISGQLREEITIQSNAILTFERREERFSDPKEGKTFVKCCHLGILSFNRNCISQLRNPKESKIYVYR